MNSNDLTSDLSRLKEIKSMLLQPSKSDAMTVCMGQCLPSGQLEDASLECLYGESCKKCGFARLWSRGLKKVLFNKKRDLQQNYELHCDDWTTSSIDDWRYVTYSIKPTVATHAQDIAQQAANTCAKSSNNIDADDEEYVPPQGNPY